MKKIKILFYSILMILLFTVTMQIDSVDSKAAASEGSGARIIEYGVFGTAKFHMANPVGKSEKLAVEAIGDKEITDISFTSNNTSICTIIPRNGYWQVSRLQEGIAVITMTCKADGEAVKRTMLMSNLSYLPNRETPNGVLKANTTVYIGCSMQEGITSDDTEVRAVVTSPANVRIVFECNAFYRVVLISGTFGDSGINYGHVLKKQVDVPITGISVPNFITMMEKETKAIGVVTIPSITTQTDFTYESSNENVIEVDNKGNMTAVGAGGAVVTVTSVSNPALHKTCRVYAKPLYPVTGIDIQPDEIEIVDGTMGKFNVTFTPANASIKEFNVKVANDDIIQVDPVGRYYALNPGTTELTVISEDGGFTDTCKVTVTPVKATGVYLQSALSMNIGATQKLGWQMLPSNASNKKVTWSSDNPAIAKVDKVGNVTAVKLGSTNIRIATDDGGFQAVCRVTVHSYVEDINVTKEKRNLTLGETSSLSIRLTPSNPTMKKIVWSSNAEDVVRVNEKGEIKALKTGVAEIMVYDRYTGAFDFCIISVAANLSKPKVKGKQSGKNLTLSWKKVKRATHYQIYKYKAKKKKFVKIATVEEKTRKYKVTKVKKGERYKVRAYYKPNKESSRWSKEVKVR